MICRCGRSSQAAIITVHPETSMLVTEFILALSLCWVLLVVWLNSITGRARSSSQGQMFAADSAFTRGLDEKDVWLDSTLFCNATEPLLRLMIRDRDRYPDLTGRDEARFHSTASRAEHFIPAVWHDC